MSLHLARVGETGDDFRVPGWKPAWWLFKDQ